MDRPTPTDPPDEPVNRIAEFIAKIEAKERMTQHVSALEDVVKSVGNDNIVEQMLARVLTTFQTRHAEVPVDTLTLKPLLRVPLKLERFELAIRYGEWIQSTLTTPGTELTDLLTEARRRLEQGPETEG